MFIWFKSEEVLKSGPTGLPVYLAEMMSHPATILLSRHVDPVPCGPRRSPRPDGLQLVLQNTPGISLKALYPSTGLRQLCRWARQKKKKKKTQ